MEATLVPLDLEAKDVWGMTATAWRRVAMAMSDRLLGLRYGGGPPSWSWAWSGRTPRSGDNKFDSQEAAMADWWFNVGMGEAYHDGAVAIVAEMKRMGFAIEVKSSRSKLYVRKSHVPPESMFGYFSLPPLCYTRSGHGPVVTAQVTVERDAFGPAGPDSVYYFRLDL